MEEMRLRAQESIERGAERYAAEPMVQKELEAITSRDADILGVELRELRHVRLWELLNAEAMRRGTDAQDLAMLLSGVEEAELAELRANRRKGFAAAIGHDDLL